MATHGILNVDKPEGWTSYRVVAVVKRLTKERRVGHGGTLDPRATGVLLVCLGQATRITEHLADSRKIYRAEVLLGRATDTYDAEGRTTFEGDASGIGLEEVEQALVAFRGPILQTPPAYSALKKDGRRLYELARAGIEVEREPRHTEVFRLDIVDWRPPIVVLEVDCGRGAYVRSLAHDLGTALGCGAYLEHLVRLRCGPFELAEAVAPDRLEEVLADGSWRERLQPLDRAVADRPPVLLPSPVIKALRNGHPVRLDSGSPERCRAYDQEGRLVALVCYTPERRLWAPTKVFSPEVPPLHEFAAGFAGALLGGDAHLDKGRLAP